MAESGSAMTVESAIDVECPVHKAFGFWRDLANAPQFMPHVKTVSVLDEKRSRWLASVTGMEIEWTAEITREVENELIEWSSIQGKKSDHTGAVYFSASDTGCRIRAKVNYQAAGSLPAPVRSTALRRLEQQVKKSLIRFRELVESSCHADG
jgi:uncharacterized membrane protein